MWGGWLDPMILGVFSNLWFFRNVWMRLLQNGISVCHFSQELVWNLQVTRTGAAHADSSEGNSILSVRSREHRDTSERVSAGCTLPGNSCVSPPCSSVLTPEVDCDIRGSLCLASNGYMDIYWFPFLYVPIKMAVLRGQTITSLGDLHTGAMEQHRCCGSKDLAALPALRHSQLMEKNIAFLGGVQSRCCACVRTPTLCPPGQL